MDGPAVYKFAVKTVPKAINELLDEIGWSADDVDVYVLHQANIRIIESVAKRLKQLWTNFRPIYSSVEIFLRQVCRFCLIKSAKMV